MSELITALFLILALLGAAIFAAGFALGANTQVEGAGLGGACAAIAAALVVWSRRLLPQEKVENPHHALRSSEPEREEAVNRFESGMRQIVGRRRWLVRIGWAAVAALGLAALFPLRSLGTNPNRRLGKTNWRRGLRLVREDGSIVRSDLLQIGSVVTAFPEGYVGSDRMRDMANDAVMVVHVDAAELALPSQRAGWAPNGFIAYSKVCTHAGCPVALYRQGPQQLMCPCHQSVFDVLDSGKVVFGPAVRSLPQLPISLDADGTLRAGGDMSDFIGPDNWNYGA
jgi:quinol---cytochrome c reductase iron-sulfur subunit